MAARALSVLSAGHGNVEVTITSAELRGTHTLDGEFQSATFEADFTAEEVTP